MSGPLPNPQRARRNAPTIPTTDLPVGGRSGRVPPVPSWLKLGRAGSAWWKWAWRTPQAAAWAKGHESFVAKRAQLEDDLAALEQVDGLDVRDLLGLPDDEAAQTIDFLVRRLHGLAAGRLSLVKECREMDDRLGLTPKSMAALRWRVVDTPAEPKSASGPAADSDRRERLRVV